jgi:hypothetical protein
MLTAGITSVILFIVVMVHELYLITENKPPTLSDSLIGATLAALVAFGIEACIIMREHNL